ncbi:MAG: serine/threonine protein kinase [Deltaproteobacteria bacterium]|nr:serine/threonine protein kinase [Deltaproteobacteria bacterium]
MAEIFLARQAGAEGFEKNIAIKKIKSNFSDSPDFVQMFLNEAKLAAQLSHPNICQIFDLGRIGDSFFIAMEYVSGRDMNRIINASNRVGIPFPMEYALKIASNCCEGLYYAHSKTDNKGHALNVVHRDVTPENVIVSFDGGVKLLDFGIAKAENLAQTDRPGEVKGKLSYMSPEQCQLKEVDHRSDIFSLGVVLYEWITGYRLFTGDNDEVIIRSIVEGKIYPPSYFKPEVSKQVEQILMKALEKDRNRRYQSAWDMQYDIDSFLTQHEFTPSNVHLANFVKQLFREDIEVERKTLSKQIRPQPPPLPEDGDRRELSSDVKVRNVDSTAEHQMVGVKVSHENLKTLSILAQKNRITIQELIAEIIRLYLKYK